MAAKTLTERCRKRAEKVAHDWAQNECMALRPDEHEDLVLMVTHAMSAAVRAERRRKEA